MSGLTEPVSRETLARLRSYEQLVRAWTAKINLVSKRDVELLWDRHIRDSLAVASLITGSDRTVVDLGSGAGFPGLVIAIANPHVHVTMIESDVRKASFLRTVRRELDLSCEVIDRRIEDVASLSPDVVTARALAALPILLGLVSRHLPRSGRALLPKGATWRDEVEAAKRDWRFSVEAVERDGQEAAGVVLTVTDLERMPDAA